VGEAIDGIAQARSLLPSDSTSPLLGLCDALEGRIALASGEIDRAETWARRLDPGHRAAVLETRIDLARGELDRAEATMATCRPETERERLDIAILAARIGHARRSPDTDALIAVALELAGTEGFVVAVTDDAVELQPLIARQLRSGRLGPYQQAMLDRIEGDRPPVMTSDASSGPLSDRELTVVRYLASRLTYREIASELYVSTNTLKTHVQRIYRKLGVSSRSEAVTEARRLGVL
jgi:LuxR family maltose regulon positive regulatory protein